jgi:hypothetical protein
MPISAGGRIVMAGLLKVQVRLAQLRLDCNRPAPQEGTTIIMPYSYDIKRQASALRK